MSGVAARSYRASAVFARCTAVVAALLACAATGVVAAPPMAAERSTVLWIVGGAVGAGLLLWVVASRLKRS